MRSTLVSSRTFQSSACASMKDILLSGCADTEAARLPLSRSMLSDC